MLMTGRDWRELREPQGEGAVVHDQQDRASTKRTEREVSGVDVDHASGSEPEEEDWRDVDELRIVRYVTTPE